MTDQIVRVKRVRGVVTPAFIDNFRHHFVNLEVYEDGLVDCWELVDLALFKGKLDDGWVATSVPDGNEISVHGLGSWTITDGRWEVDAEAMYTRVVELVRELNPAMENLHDCHGTTTVQMPGGYKQSILGIANGHAVRPADKSWKPAIRGDDASVFVKVGDVVYLAELRAYADGVVQLARLPEVQTLDLEGLAREVKAKRVVTKLKPGTRVVIHQLGSFAIVKEGYATKIADVIGEVPDLIDRANQRPDSVDRCRVAYAAYLAKPTKTTQEALRVSYESVPAHKRMYVGDQDTKDVAVRMILYGDKEIERWSHRAVARAQGHAKLPTITVPRPKSSRSAKTKRRAPTRGRSRR